MIKLLGIFTVMTLMATSVQPQQYIDQFIVIEVKGDEIHLADEGDNAFVWDAEPGEQWEEYDYAVGIMNDNGTPDDITDDRIEQIRYVGHYIKQGVVSLY